MNTEQHMEFDLA